MLYANVDNPLLCKLEELLHDITKKLIPTKTTTTPYSESKPAESLKYKPKIPHKELCTESIQNFTVPKQEIQTRNAGATHMPPLAMSSGG